MTQNRELKVLGNVMRTNPKGEPETKKTRRVEQKQLFLSFEQDTTGTVRNSKFSL